MSKDLLCFALLVGALLLATRALRPRSSLGRALPVPPCVPIELRGQGVACLAPAEARRRHLRAGSGMAPDRLAAWGVPIDVNHGTLAELASLQGVGPKLAARIVAARPFRSVDEVARVRGIGRRRLERLRARLSLGQ